MSQLILCELCEFREFPRLTTAVFFSVDEKQFAIGKENGLDFCAVWTGFY